jgi:hypothetical protein
MTLTPLPAGRALETYFLEARSKLLDLAAMLDRIDRGGEAGEARADPRIARIRQALAILGEGGPDRAARVQEIFSLPYDPNWTLPTPR